MVPIFIVFLWARPPKNSLNENNAAESAVPVVSAWSLYVWSNAFSLNWASLLTANPARHTIKVNMYLISCLRIWTGPA